MGFSLVILGFLIVAALHMYKSYQSQREVSNEQATRERIVSALALFAEKNDRLPCPADPTLTPDDADFGKEPAGCSAGGPPPAGAYLTGMVPVSALDLPFRHAADSHSRKLTYAVTQALTKTNGMNDAAAIQVTNNNGETRLVPFIIVSHGADGKGAIGLMGRVAGIPCTGAAADVENCNGDQRFRDFQVSHAGGANGPDWFDDHVSYSLASRETSLWVAAPSPTGMVISNKNNANVGIGKTMPEAKLHVNGPVKVDSNAADVKVTATGTISAKTTGVAGTGDIVSEKELEAGTVMQGDKIKATVFTYDPPPP